MTKSDWSNKQLDASTLFKHADDFGPLPQRGQISKSGDGAGVVVFILIVLPVVILI